MNFANLLTSGNWLYPKYPFDTALAKDIISGILIVLVALVALAIIVLILLQPANSSGINALGGSSETFFGKNKGKSIEAKMKFWTIIGLVVLAVLSITFIILQIPTIWGATYTPTT